MASNTTRKTNAGEALPPQSSAVKTLIYVFVADGSLPRLPALVA
jgi:hypothetical protein